MRPIVTDSADKGASAVVRAVTALAGRGRYAPTTSEIWRELGGPSGVTAAVTAAKQAGLVEVGKTKDGSGNKVRHVALVANAHHLPVGAE